VLISEVEPALSPLVIHSILAVFLGSSAVISGFLIVWSDTHSRRTVRRLSAMIVTGVILFSGGLTGWNVGGDELRDAADARFAALLAERFDAVSSSSYAAVKADLAQGEARITVTSGGQELPVAIRKAGGQLQFFSAAGVEYLPSPHP
jgi:hypothetical protein